MGDGGVGCLGRAARYTKMQRHTRSCPEPVLRDYYRALQKNTRMGRAELRASDRESAAERRRSTRVETVTTKPFFWDAFILPEGRPAEPPRLGQPEAGGPVLFNCADVMRGREARKVGMCSSSMRSVAIDAGTIRLLPGGA
jgi:hypothetical protein